MNHILKYTDMKGILIKFRPLLATKQVSFFNIYIFFYLQRAGVLGLMLHSTYNHEVMERIAKVNENGKLQEGS